MIKPPSDGRSAMLPIFRAPIDSGCTASCTDSLERLVNVRKCNETFNVADGKTSACTAIGDMPVLIKDSSGKLSRFVFTNVRYVPDFKYTLLSVKQLWRDQQIKSRFADENELVFPSKVSVPFDPRFKLYVITLVSEPMLLSHFNNVGRSGNVTPNQQASCLGFHDQVNLTHRAPARGSGSRA